MMERWSNGASLLVLKGYGGLDARRTTCGGQGWACPARQALTRQFPFTSPLLEPPFTMSSSHALQLLAAQFARQMASTAGSGIGRKVAVLGAAGGIGQPLSMLMKVSLGLVPTSLAPHHLDTAMILSVFRPPHTPFRR